MNTSSEILKWASVGESAVVRALVADILKRGCRIRVHDGEEWATKITNCEQTILEALCSTGEDTLWVFEGEEKVRRGMFWLIYGNADDGSELLADWTDSEFMNDIVTAIGYMEV